MGVVNILKTLAQSSGPSLTGILAGRGHFWVAFVVAGSLKAAYDVMLLAFFGGKVRPRKDGPVEESGDLSDESGDRLVQESGNRPVQDPSDSLPEAPIPEPGVTSDQAVVGGTTRL